MTIAPELETRTIQAPRSGATTKPGALPKTIFVNPSVDDALASAPLRATRGLWAAVQAFTIQYVVLLLAVLTTVLSTPYSIGGTPWNDSTRMAALLLLLGHGAQPTLAGNVISFVPLGLTCFSLVTCYFSAGRCAVATRSAFWTGLVAYPLLLVAVALVAKLGLRATLTTAVGAFVVMAISLMLALLRERALADVFRSLTDKLPARARLPREGIIGLKVGAMAVFTLLGACAVLVGYWSITSRAMAAETLALLAPGSVGIVMLAVGQLAVLPNLVAWTAAWLIGPGFSLGTGSNYSTGEWSGGALPQLPLLSALPPGVWSGGLFRLLMAIVVVIGMAAGFVARREAGLLKWRPCVLLIGTASLVFGLAMTALQWLAGGRLGSGRFANVGANPWLVGGVGAAQVAVGLGLVFLGAQLWHRRGELGKHMPVGWRRTNTANPREHTE